MKLLILFLIFFLIILEFNKADMPIHCLKHLVNDNKIFKSVLKTNNEKYDIDNLLEKLVKNSKKNNI